MITITHICGHTESTRVDEWAQRAVDAGRRTPEQQLDALDQRLGKDIGATKQRKRILQKAMKESLGSKE